MDTLSVRPFESELDYCAMVDYFVGASDEALLAMGVDRGKVPSREAWVERAWKDHQLPEDDPRRERFYLAWVLDDLLVGHSSINGIQWGKQAFGHLHLWRRDLRMNGAGTRFFRRSVDLYFRRFRLETLHVEPYAENPAPNRVLQKLGFTLVTRYRTVPGPINFEQDVNRYTMTRAEWDAGPGRASSPA